MKTFVQDGKIMNYANAGSAIASGDVVAIGSSGIGVACVDIAATTGSGAVQIEGVFTLAKTTSQAWTQGQRLYWNPGTSKLTNDPDADETTVFAGIAFEAAGSSATTGLCKLSGMASLPTQAGNVAQLAGTLTGTVDGTITDVAAVSTAGGNTYADSAINTAITSINLQHKELQTTLNAVLSALKACDLMVPDTI